MVLESAQALNLLQQITAKLASTSSIVDITRLISDEIAALGLAAVWIAVIDEETGDLVTVRRLIDGRDTGHEMPRITAVDMNQPMGHGFGKPRMINIPDPSQLFAIENHPEGIPNEKLVLPRVIFDHMGEHPFAYGPLLGSRGQAVGALGLSSYLGRQPIPDELFEQGLLPAFMNHLGIAMERALSLQRLERLNTELVRTQDLLVKESRMRGVGELAAAVAHDLNTYSNIALMSASLAQRGTTDVLSALLRIERANRTIGEIAHRLQRVASTGADAQGRSNLRQIVDDVAHLMGPLCAEGLVMLTLDLGNMGPVFVHGDPSMVRRAVTNVLLNARESLLNQPIESRRIDVTLTQAGLEVRLQIRDFGPGIAPEVLREIFRAFVTTTAGHSGLGLSSAYASMKHFGGQMIARNMPDGGACFELTFVASAPVANEVARPLPAASLSSRKVLVIDDEPDFLDVVRFSLSDLGHQTLGCMNGEEAVRLARDQRPDLALCDVGLPGRSGLELIETLQPYVRRVVLMTGWDDEAVKADKRSRAAHGLLHKPFEADELRRILLMAFHEEPGPPS